MRESWLFFVAAAVFLTGAALTIKRGWYPFPFYRLYRERAGAAFWLLVAINVVAGLFAVAAGMATLISN